MVSLGLPHLLSKTWMQDNDGRLSPEEWDEAFNQIDTDDSGFISEDEWDNPYFKELDADEDGVISEKEWGDGFNILDADEDGFISENEFYKAHRC